MWCFFKIKVYSYNVQRSPLENITVHLARKSVHNLQSVCWDKSFKMMTPLFSVCYLIWFISVWTHMEFWWLEAEVGESVAQLPLRLHHLWQLTGQRLSQLYHILVFPFVVPQHFNLSLQLQVHGPRAPTQLFWQDLPGALQGRAGM